MARRRCRVPVDAALGVAFLACIASERSCSAHEEDEMTTLKEPETKLDEATMEAFADRMIGVLNDACTALLTSIGHQTGLFSTLAATGPATSQQVAESGKLNERYVREWLNAMTTARLVWYDPETRRYTLPQEHAVWLVDGAGPDNLARIMLFVPMIAEVEQGIVRCFREGGGLPYAAYSRFHAVMAEDSTAVVDATLLQQTVPLVDGLDPRLRVGVDVADIGCGSGHLINVLARAYPASRFTGYDFSEEVIAAGRAEAEAWGLSNAKFELSDVATLDRPDAFDVITAFDAIHDQAHPAQVLTAIARALRPGGIFVMVDIRAASAVEENLELPWATFLYTTSTMHCMPVSLGLHGDGLGAVWGEQLATQMLYEAGFTDIAIHAVESDPLNSYYVARAD
jgi:2-polyprenyl-3-methyl-5-hydroxy-6-metoxy-1,4-benzoquinol methylase